MDQDKRRARQLKRDVKKAGNRKLRNHLKRQLAESPEDAAHVDDFDYGRNSSETLNGMDKDATRQRKKKGEESDATEREIDECDLDDGDVNEETPAG